VALYTYMTAEFLGSNANQMTEKIGPLMELSILAVRNSESVPRWRTTSLSRPNYICLSNCGKLGIDFNEKSGLYK
jgi:hypothetical protein